MPSPKPSTQLEQYQEEYFKRKERLKQWHKAPLKALKFKYARARGEQE